VRKKEIKEMYLKRFDMEKNIENEKNQEKLKQYENELKNKLKKKVDNVLINKSIDIKDSMNEKKNSRKTTSSQRKTKTLTIFEDFSEKINPLNLIENFNRENCSNYKEEKEEKEPSVIESNDIQIKKIRNEISSLKNIINVTIKISKLRYSFEFFFLSFHF